MNRARRLLCGTIALWLLGAGCLPYVYPKMDRIPSSDLGVEATDVHAFRVDVTANVALVIGESGQYTLTEITPRPDGSIPPQTHVTVEYGSIFLRYPLGHKHQTRVRLYRPGYQLVERNAWETAGAVSWQPATDWNAQQKALDDLIARPILSPYYFNRSEEYPQPPTSPEAEQALLYIASEYERVAKLAPTPGDRTYLQSKARKIRETVSGATQPNSAPTSRPTSASP